MYITNPEKIDKDKLYSCNGVIANWLIYQKQIPLFGRGKNGEYFFAKTEMLEKALKEVPFYINITKRLF